MLEVCKSRFRKRFGSCHLGVEEPPNSAGHEVVKGHPKAWFTWGAEAEGPWEGDRGKEGIAKC